MQNGRTSGQEEGVGSRAGRRRPGAIAEETLEKLFGSLPPHSEQAEIALLGSLMLDASVIGDIIGLVSKPEQFYSLTHGEIFRAMLELHNETRAIDLVPLAELLKARGVLEAAGGTEFLVSLAEAVPSARNAVHYARIVADKSRLRRLISTAGEIMQMAFGAGEVAGGDEGDEILDAAEQMIFEIAGERETQGPERLSDLLRQEIIRIELQSEGKGVSGLPTGFTDLDEMLGGMQPGEMIVLAARPSMGKAQPLDARVLTTRGFVPMGTLEIGDELASVDGAPSRVVGVFPQGERQVYRVIFSDGRSAEACEEHLWRVHFRGWDGARVCSTGELRAMLAKQRYNRRLFIEAFTGEFGDDQDLPIDPWLLGMLIGDGNFKASSRTNPESGTVRISAGDPAVVARLGESLGAMGLVLKPLGGVDFRVIRDRSQPGAVATRANPLKDAIVELGLWNCGADRKFIPERYLRAGRGSRRALLAGLVDSDGWVESFGAIRFSTASRRLADEVVELMRSLGGSGSWTRKRTFYTYGGVRREGLPAFVCNLQHPYPVALGFTPAKRERLGAGRARQRRLNIVSIEPTRIAPTRCIAVSHPSRLYITDGFVVTHNTALSLNLAEQIAFGGRTPWSPRHEGGDPAPVGFFSLEMSREALVQRLLSARSGIDAHKIRTGQLGGGGQSVMSAWEKINEAAAELYEAPLYIDDSPGLTVLQLRAKARRMKDRYGLKVIIIDYLQLITAPGAARESRQVEVSTISRQIKAMARELRVPVLCLAQLNRGAEQRERNRPRMSDLRESGSIEQDADVVMLLHREAYYHKDDEEWLNDPDNEDRLNLTELIVAKQRNGPTGVVKLTWDDSIVRFKNFDWRHGAYDGSGGARSAPSVSGFAPSPPFDQSRPGDEPPEIHVRPGDSRFSPGRPTGPVSDHRDGGGPDRAGSVEDEYEDDDLPPF